jgi:hypothetical protein
MTRGTGRKLALVYAAACAIAVLYAAYKFTMSPGQSELAAVPLVVLGLPWSLAAPVAMAMLGSSAWLAAAAVVLGCVLNLWLLSRAGAR